MKGTTSAWVLAAAATIGAAGVAVGEAPLARLPGSPGPHVAKIKALGHRSWLNLGRPAADPRWGPAPGRSYTPKMAFAADLRGAFLAGEGVHNASRKIRGRTYYNDDLFFYDINAHRWICLYPGAEIDKLKRTLDDNGWEVTEAGEPTPVQQLGHGYEQTAYIGHLRKFMFIPAHKLLWRNSVVGRKRLSWLKDPADPHLLSDPRYYDVAIGKWQRQHARGEPAWAEKNTTNRVECGALVYSAKSRRIIFCVAHKSLWLYDYDKQTWSACKPKGRGPDRHGSYEGILCLDTRRDRIYLFKEVSRYQKAPDAFPMVYDIGSNTWLDVEPANQPPADRRRAHSTAALANYDVVNDVVVFFQLRGRDPKDRGVRVYGPAGSAWANELTAFPPDWNHRAACNAFYDPRLNAHFIHQAGDSRANGVIWVYRHRRAAPSATAAGN